MCCTPQNDPTAGDVVAPVDEQPAAVEPTVDTASTVEAPAEVEAPAGDVGEVEPVAEVDATAGQSVDAPARVIGPPAGVEPDAAVPTVVEGQQATPAPSPADVATVSGSESPTQPADAAASVEGETPTRLSADVDELRAAIAGGDVEKVRGLVDKVLGDLSTLLHDLEL